MYPNMCAWRVDICWSERKRLCRYGGGLTRREKSPGEVCDYFPRAFIEFETKEKKMEAKQKNSRIAWICLIAAGLIEIVWAYFMKLSYGFTRPLPTLITAFFLAVSFFMLERGIREFGIGMSYAVFTGIGIAGTTVLGLVLFGESADLLKIMSLLVLLTGIIGLKFCEGGEETEKNKGSEGGSGAAAADDTAAGAGNFGKERE